MSEGERPIPVPRPRQTKSIDETDRSSKVYENYALPTKSGSVYDNLNAQLDEIKSDAVHRPVPVPRARVSATAAKRDYENSPDTARPLNNQQQSAEHSPARTTGAIRKAPSIPSVKNNFDESEPIVTRTPEERSLKDFDVLSLGSSTSGKSSGDSKFATPSPG